MDNKSGMERGHARNWEGRGGVESVSVLIEYKGLDDQGGSSGVR